jgi:urease accessory protein
MKELPRLKEKHTTCKRRAWSASLTLGFAWDPAYHSGPRTRLHHVTFHGPLRVQRPFYPEQEVCHVYLLHPPGGLVSGDALTIRLQCMQGSHALLTTPSASKIYRSDSQQIIQSQQVDIEVEQHAICEWLPMETIVFDGAHGRLATTIQLFGDAKFIGLDVFCLGRPKSSLPFVSGSIEQRLSLYHDGTPLFLERLCLQADDPLLNACSGFNGALVSGTFIVFGLKKDAATIATTLRSVFATWFTDTLSITVRLGVLVVRYLGDCSEQAQQQLRACWQQVRPALIGRAACVPRIWQT